MRIAGVDEAGRGPLAGPVVAAAVILPKRYRNKEIDDSKKLAREKREYLFEIIRRDAVSWAIVAVGHRRVDSMNILQASRLAMKLAVERVRPDKAMIDGNVPIDIGVPQELVIGGDGSVLCIAAASILAKVWRDGLMSKLGGKYPGYGFEHHAGYATREHRDAIGMLGPCRVHRTTFGCVRNYAETDNPEED